MEYIPKYQRNKDLVEKHQASKTIDKFIKSDVYSSAPATAMSENSRDTLFGAANKLLNEIKSIKRKFQFGGSIDSSTNNINVNPKTRNYSSKASTTYLQPVPIPRIYKNKEDDSGSISIGDSSKKMRNTRETPEEYWSYGSEIKRNIRRMGNSIDKTTNKLILPAAALTSMVVGGTAGNLTGSAYFGNRMSKSEDPIAEGTAAVVGQFKSPLSETAKRVGGFNDLKTAYNEFKKGEIGSGFLNLATGIGGVYDSKWIPGKYDDIIDKGLELVNLYGDSKDVYNSVKHNLDVGEEGLQTFPNSLDSSGKTYGRFKEPKSLLNSGNKIQKNRQGGELPFGLPLKSANPHLIPKYTQPKVGNIILPDLNRPILPGTNATENKIGIGTDEGEILIPTIVNGQWMSYDDAVTRYKLTRERFKEMIDPSTYSKYYNMRTFRPIKKHQKGSIIYKKENLDTIQEILNTIKNLWKK